MNIDQAAKRAAEQIDHRKWDKEMNMAETKQIIAAEFAPLQERLVEAERLLGRAIGRFECFKCDEDGSCKQHDTIYTDIDKFLAAKDNGNGEPWPEKPSADYVCERVCTLVSDVWDNNFTSENANDCFCKAGGLWESSSYDGTYEKGFRHGGEAVMWLEQAAKAMKGIPDPAKFVEAFHAMLSALRYSHAIVKNISLGGKEHHNGAADDAVVLIERAIDKALAAKPTDPPKEAKR